MIEDTIYACKDDIDDKCRVSCERRELHKKKDWDGYYTCGYSFVKLKCPYRIIPKKPTANKQKSQSKTTK